MEKQTYTTEERTKAQFHAMYLKQRGYQVVALKEKNHFGENTVVAFGYKATDTLIIKPTFEARFEGVEENEFDFIYWN